MNKYFGRQAINWLALFIVNLAIIGILAILAPEFKNINTYTILLQRMSEYAILAIGLSVVIIGGGLDLSFGSVMALSGTICGLLFAAGLPFSMALIISLICCALVGLLSSIIIVKLRLNDIIVTLAMMMIIRSVVLGITGGKTVTGFPPEFLNLAKVQFFNIPFHFMIVIVVATITLIILKVTTFGRQLYAVGGNPVAANISGIGINRVKYFVYTFNGFLAGIAGLLLAMRSHSVPPTTGNFALLEVITAVAIGGVLFTGGEGSIIGPILGISAFYLLTTGFNMLGVNQFYKLILLGVILIVILGRETIGHSFSRMGRALRRQKI
jgi:ribose/xylose/arabinose/galactoside ABC-type transport system permease subunit